MVAFIVRVFVLALATRRTWPDVPPDRILAVAVSAAHAETAQIRAELLIAIAQHESDLEPSAVSWIENGHRVDRVHGWVPGDRPLVCGYEQAQLRRGACLAAIEHDGAMSAGVLELREWFATCHGNAACAMRGHAGGWSCAVQNVCSAPARAFSELFLENARRLSR